MQQLSENIGSAKTRVDGRSSFVKAAIKWSAEFGENRNGFPELHIMLAEYIFSESPEVMLLFYKVGKESKINVIEINMDLLMRHQPPAIQVDYPQHDVAGVIEDNPIVLG